MGFAKGKSSSYNCRFLIQFNFQISVQKDAEKDLEQGRVANFFLYRADHEPCPLRALPDAKSPVRWWTGSVVGGGLDGQRAWRPEQESTRAEPPEEPQGTMGGLAAEQRAPGKT